MHWQFPFRSRADNLGLELSESAPHNPTSSVPPQVLGHSSSGAASPSYTIYFTPLSNWICGGSTKGLYGQTLLSARPSTDVASSQNGAFHAGAKGQCQAFLCLLSCALGSALFKKLASKAPRQEIFKQSEKPGFCELLSGNLGSCTSFSLAVPPVSAPIALHGTRAFTQPEHTPCAPAKITHTRSQGICSQEKSGYSQPATKNFFKVNFFS